MLRTPAKLYLDYRLGLLKDPSSQPLAWAIRQLFVNPHCALTGLDYELRQQASQCVDELREEFTRVLSAPGLIRIKAHESLDPEYAKRLWQRLTRLIAQTETEKKTRTLRMAVVIQMELPSELALNEMVALNELGDLLQNQGVRMLTQAAKDGRLPMIARTCIEHPDLPRFKVLFPRPWARRARRKQRTPSEAILRRAVFHTFRRHPKNYVLHWNDEHGWSVTVRHYHPDRRSQTFKVQLFGNELRFIPVD